MTRARVRRIDFATTLAAPVRRADGSIIVEGRIARTGVQTYRNADGSSRVEYRPPNEVKRSMQSMRLVPVTNDHPPTMGDATMWRTLAVGTIGENIRADGQWIIAPLAIFDAATVTAMQGGKNKISAGYECEMDETPGTTPEGEHYDAVQRDITINHVAVVDNARAGADAAVRMDAAYSNEPATPAQPKETTVNEDLCGACAKHNVKYDSADERGSALRLLAACGYPGDSATPNGERLDCRSETYLATRATSAAHYREVDAAVRSARAAAHPRRADRFDVERDDEERYDERAVHYDSRIGEELYDTQDAELGASEPGVLRFDQQGMLIGDYYRSDAYEDTRQDFLDRQATAWIPATYRDVKEGKEAREQAIADRKALRGIDNRARADAEQFGTRRVEHVSPEQLAAARHKTDKARADMLADRPRVADPLAAKGGK